LIDWIFVTDVVAGFLKLAVAPDVEGRTIDLGSGTVISTRELVDTICGVANAGVQPVYGALPDRPLEPLRVARVHETSRLIGWSPEVALPVGLARTIDWYRQHPVSPS
jgi:nucleoside-diphosphate-sugar epimerase